MKRRVFGALILIVLSACSERDAHRIWSDQQYVWYDNMRLMERQKLSNLKPPFIDSLNKAYRRDQTPSSKIQAVHKLRMTDRPSITGDFTGKSLIPIIDKVVFIDIDSSWTCDEFFPVIYTAGASGFSDVAVDFEKDTVYFSLPSYFPGQSQNLEAWIAGVPFNITYRDEVGNRRPAEFLNATIEVGSDLRLKSALEELNGEFSFDDGNRLMLRLDSIKNALHNIYDFADHGLIKIRIGCSEKARIVFDLLEAVKSVKKTFYDRTTGDSVIVDFFEYVGFLKPTRIEDLRHAW